MTLHWHQADRHDELRCSMPTLNDQGGGPDEDEPLLAECGEPVFLSWLMTIDPALTLDNDEAAGAAAYSSGWSLMCAAGHVHAVSAQEDRVAAPYSPELVGLPPAPPPR